MKILFLSAAKSIHTVKWVNAFAGRGHEVFLVYNKGHEPKEDMLDGRIHLHCLKYGGGAGYYLNAPELRKLTEKIAPDVINVHYASGYGTLARCAHLPGYILSIWGSDVYEFPYQGRIKCRILKKNVRNARYLASTSNCMAAQLKNVMGDQSLEMTITPFGVDLGLFNPEQYSEKKSEDIVIGTIKALEDKYGIKELLTAFGKLRTELLEEQFERPVKLVIYGDGSQKEELGRLIQDMGLSGCAELKGRIPNVKVPETLNGLDIFCALSKKESFGVSAVEAMAMKKPVVVSDADGFKEVVENGQTGIIVSRENADEAKAAMKKLVLDQELRRAMGQKGRERVEKFYAWEGNVDIMLKLYEEAVKKGS